MKIKRHGNRTTVIHMNNMGDVCTITLFSYEQLVARLYWIHGKDGDVGGWYYWAQDKIVLSKASKQHLAEFEVEYVAEIEGIAA